MAPCAENTVRDLTFGRCVIQASIRQILIDGQPARLGARAFDVLMALVQRRDTVISKNELLDIVWPGLVVKENNLEVQVSALRKLLGSQTIVTIPGRSYRFFRLCRMPSRGRQPTTSRRLNRLHHPHHAH